MQDWGMEAWADWQVKAAEISKVTERIVRQQEKNGFKLTVRLS